MNRFYQDLNSYYAQNEPDESCFKNLLSEHDLKELDLPSYVLPRVYRGLPKTSAHQNLDLQVIDQPFRDFTHLKKLALEKALAALYRPYSLPEKAKVVLLCTVYWDGLGDLYSGETAANILKKRFPHLDLTLIILKRKGREIPSLSIPHEVLSFEIDDQKALIYKPFPSHLVKKMEEACLLLQFPTYYTPTPKLLKALNLKPACKVIGEAGFLQHAHFTPEKEHSCMGLHFLEKGLIIKPCPTKQKAPSPYYFAYTRTAEGLKLYLEALLKWKEKESSPLLIYIFKLQDVLKLLQDEKVLQFFRKHGIGHVEVITEKYVSPLPLQSKGKKICFRFFEQVSNETFFSLLAKSEAFVACTGDGSLFEAISLGKIFFYDMPEHKSDLIRDLIALAEAKAPACQPFLSCFFPGENHGEQMGLLLKEEKVQTAFTHLNCIIRNEHAVNDFLENLVLREALHHRFPHLKQTEEGLLKSFSENVICAKTFLLEIKKHLERFFQNVR